MFLAILDGKVLERNDESALLRSYQHPVEIIEWNNPLPPIDRSIGEDHVDPRTSEQKTSDNDKRYRLRRLRAYPSLRKQLDMMYWDEMDGTTLWVDDITRIKELYPKPEE